MEGRVSFVETEISSLETDVDGLKMTFGRHVQRLEHAEGGVGGPSELGGCTRLIPGGASEAPAVLRGNQACHGGFREEVGAAWSGL